MDEKAQKIGEIRVFPTRNGSLPDSLAQSPPFPLSFVTLVMLQIAHSLTMISLPGNISHPSGPKP
jgi:hypothetical protein